MGNLHKVLAFLLTVIIASALEARGVWRRQDFPHPLYDVTDCRGSYDHASHVCDPDGWLKDKERDILESVILHLNNATECSCPPTYNDTCEGYRLGVAMVTSIGVDSGSPTTDDVALSSTQQFAEYLRDVSWLLGNCSEDIYVTVNVQDSKLWTAMGHQTATVLTPDCAIRIFEEAKEFFTRNDIAGALVYMVEQFRLVLSRQRRCSVSLLWYALGPVLALLILLVLAVLLYWRYKIRDRNMVRKFVPEKLEDPKLSKDLLKV